MLPEGERLELFLPMTAFGRGEAGAREAARSAARSRAEGALISALAPRLHGNVSFPHFRRDWKAATSI